MTSHSPSSQDGKYKFSWPVLRVPAVIGGDVSTSVSKREAMGDAGNVAAPAEAELPVKMKAAADAAAGTCKAN